jgi:hypothetical protein
MSEFLAEMYASVAGSTSGHPAAETLSRAADRLTLEGLEVRLLRSIAVPEEETCLYLFRAPSREAVHEVGSRAGVHFDCVAEVISTATTEPRPANPAPDPDLDDHNVQREESR